MKPLDPKTAERLLAALKDPDVSMADIRKRFNVGPKTTTPLVDQHNIAFRIEKRRGGSGPGIIRRKVRADCPTTRQVAAESRARRNGARGERARSRRGAADREVLAAGVARVHRDGWSPLDRLYIPLRTVSALNMREHWAAKSRRIAAERDTTRKAWLAAGVAIPVLPALITLTRLSTTSRKLDGDNLQSALKGVRDELAAIIGVDDGCDQVGWKYEQRKNQAKEYAVEVNITEIGF